MKIKEIRWIKKVGYQIVERELGKEFVKEFGTRHHQQTINVRVGV